MARSDHYAILGVARDASDDQIRSAYRKLARQYHPDVNSDDGASARFREVTEAYEVLSDPQRRQRYDMFGSAEGAAGFGIDDLFNTVKGGDRVIKVPRLETCERCGGDGAEPGSTIVTCATCGGRGELRQVQQSVFGRFVNVSSCPRCGGSGKTVDKLCTRC